MFAIIAARCPLRPVQTLLNRARRCGPSDRIILVMAVAGFVVLRRLTALLDPRVTPSFTTLARALA